MRPILLATLVAVSFLLPRPAAAQVSVQLRFDLPVVLPGLVVIEQGIQVVPQQSEEVFFVDGYYWARRDDRWYRSRDHRGGWVFIEPRWVPARLVRIPPGYYRRWEPARGYHDREAHERWEREHEWEKHQREQYREHEKERREDRKEADKRDREERREERKERKERRKDD